MIEKIVNKFIILRILPIFEVRKENTNKKQRGRREMKETVRERRDGR